MKKLVLSLAIVSSIFAAPALAKQPTLHEAISQSLAAQTQIVKQQLTLQTKRSSIHNLAEMRKEIPYRVVVYASVEASQNDINESSKRVQPE
ncbi:hypothetical protein ACFOD1_08385 [Pseudidiomarina halophila]|uniref:Uncharacterized protein n=1 Tax=Pseudidiomarina halophila TaxID=1449799 RepID=A0A432Y1S1_9GAMM|nr:hypothetical protein [Pseudidiomarina halophila]RUO54876.1 hypothetical protein CWI69_05615 [Pseudidiomarina halophila]